VQHTASPAVATATTAHMLGLELWVHMYVLGFRVCIEAAPEAPVQHTTKAHILGLGVWFHMYVLGFA